jgi:3-methyladenine DNA glycosylase AlkC
MPKRSKNPQSKNLKLIKLGNKVYQVDKELLQIEEYFTEKEVSENAKKFFKFKTASNKFKLFLIKVFSKFK